MRPLLGENRAGGQGPRNAADSTTWMGRPTTAEEASKGRSILGCFGRGPGNKLIQGVLAMMDMPACHTIARLDIRRREHFFGHDQVAHTRDISF